LFVEKARVMTGSKEIEGGNVEALRPSLGHNRSHIPAEELAAELAALQEAEARTEETKLREPDLVEFMYEVRFYPGDALIKGELQAYDQTHARRVLHVILGVPHLPIETRIIEKHIIDAERREKNAAQNRRILKSLTTHHHWLQGRQDGVRADLAGENLSQTNLEGRNLSHVNMANALLAGAKLSGAKMIGTDLTSADLSGADLSGCDLSNASLADANLIGANLTGAVVKGADLWRANLARTIISPETLHEALGCTYPDK
jgi:uncharacterized protein YjbI with pentapeptide repeats